MEMFMSKLLTFLVLYNTYTLSIAVYCDDDTCNLGKELTALVKREVGKGLARAKQEIRPAFTAHFKTGGMIPLAKGQILIFDKVQINVGGGYNPTTGYFTVPKAGLYLVSCTVRSNGGKHLHVWLKKNDNRVTLAYGGNWNEGSFSIPVQAAEGDRLVIVHDTGSYVNNEYVQGSIISFFSAVFISD
ncbi:complement C1q-like protein 3 [Mytilus edulis]|uniref:complement C1q-like protein 3 n=1 Tax=Mytilus edulis TaxID=6550 RepID=UPI0039EFF11C